MIIVSIPILKLFCLGPVKNYTFCNSMLGVMSLNSNCRGQKTVQHTQLKHHDSETSSVMQATCTSQWIKGTRSLHNQLLVCTSTSSQPTILHPEKQHVFWMVKPVTPGCTEHTGWKIYTQGAHLTGELQALDHVLIMSWSVDPKITRSFTLWCQVLKTTHWG